MGVACLQKRGEGLVAKDVELELRWYYNGWRNRPVQLWAR